MAATFGSPVSAVLLAIELLLFEFRPRSIIPVALASATAAGVRAAFEGGFHPVFAMPELAQFSGASLTAYILIGAIIGVASVGVTRVVYAVEDAFEHLPIHWMWWPVVGAVVVGIVGYISPDTLGVGYYNISNILSAKLTLKVAALLCLWKFVSWSIYLGSGTSGGTLAPLFTIGGAMGLLLGAGSASVFPAAHVDPRIAALVGMAAMFAGASRALLASAVFSFETTLQPLGLLPLLGGCTASFLVSCLLMRNTIMTEKIARRGVRVPVEYAPDFLDMVLVREVMSNNPVTLRANQTVGEVRGWLASQVKGTSHQGFPIVDDQTGLIVGVLTRRDLLRGEHDGQTELKALVKRPPSVVYADRTLRDAADHMVNHDIGRLPVVSQDEPGRVIGMITRSDLLGAHRLRISAHRHASATFSFGRSSNGQAAGR
jgi:CBS domain-containing protein